MTSKVSGLIFTVIQAVFATLIETVVSVVSNNTVMRSCNHEEADTMQTSIIHIACAGVGIEEN